MFLRITAGEDAPVILEEPDDFTRFHVEVVGLDAGELRTQVKRCRVGYVTADGHVAVTVAAIKTLAGHRSPAWGKSLDDMLNYARSKGWMPDEHHIQGHCIRRT